MHAFRSVEPDRQEIRLQVERRVLMGVLAGLLLTTALVSPLAFGSLPLLLLLATPLALALLLAVAVAPLSVSAQAARSHRDREAAMLATRQAAATKHAIVTPRRNTLVHDEPAALAAAIAAAAAHGIHFGCQRLTDEDFLQAFHANEIRAADFRHGDHLRYTVLMLQRVPAGLVEETVAINLRAFLRVACGSETLFHATRTHAWITILRAHLQATPRSGFATLLQRHADDLRGDAIHRFYSKDLLNSEEARRRTVKPDRQPLPVV